jgi:membrane protease YdiL (CAAX protease family)
LLAWLLPPVIAFLAFAISLLFPNVSFTPDMAGMFARYENILSSEELEQMRLSNEALPISPIWIGLLSGLIAGVTINAIAGLGEEWGWRGFMVRSLQQKSFFYTSLFIGLVWGVWHAPIILMGHNYPEHPVVGVLMMIIWCMLLSPLFLYVTLKTKSVLAAAIMHGTLNGTAGLAIILIQGGDDLLVGVTGLSGFIALAITIAGLYFYDTRISKEQIMRSLVKQHIQ